MSVTPITRRFAPAAPPAEVLEEIDAALAVADALAADGIELHIGKRGPRRCRIELRDTDGALLRALLPSELLELGVGRLTV